MNKLKNFFSGRGVYLAVLAAAVVICVGGLFAANMLSKDKDNEPQDKDAISSTDDGWEIIVPPSTATPNTSASPGATGTNGPTATGTGTKAPEGTSSPGNNDVPKISMAMPVSGEILVDYAMDKLVFNKTLQEWRTHPGIDIKCDFGADVKAAADGKVSDVKKDPRYGYLVIIEHSSGIKSVYANLKEESPVKIGQQVKQGDTIGWVGNTAPFEREEESHMHFEVLYNETNMNVWNYLPKQS